MSTTFTARYAGFCADCGERIHEGDEITYNTEHKVVHATCPDTPDLAPSPKGVCKSCFIALPMAATSDECDECRDA